MEKENYIYFAGDLFVSNEDNIDIHSVVKNLIKENICILNIEGVTNFQNGDNKKIPRKAVPLSMNPSILELGKLDNCFFSLVNNHASDNGVAAFNEFSEKMGKNVIISRTTDDDPRKKVDSINIILFADEREECKCKDYNFLRFDKSIILKNKEFIQGSYVVVHGGLEYRKHPTPYQRHLSHLLVDLGAEAVIFHHSHIGGDHEWYNEKLIHYGLGNFYFSSVQGLHGDKSFDGKILRLSSTTKKFEVASIEFRNFSINEAFSNLNFTPLNKRTELNFIEQFQYKIWYKTKYHIDSSLRPRQLYLSEFTIRLQYFIWYKAASFLVRKKLTSKVKKAIRLITKK